MGYRLTDKDIRATAELLNGSLKSRRSKLRVDLGGDISGWSLYEAKASDGGHMRTLLYGVSGREVYTYLQGMLQSLSMTRKNSGLVGS